ncbi:MAG: hypothetical protein ACLTYW_09190 [Collinsella sp.]
MTLCRRFGRFDRHCIGYDPTIASARGTLAQLDATLKQAKTTLSQTDASLAKVQDKLATAANDMRRCRPLSLWAS